MTVRKHRDGITGQTLLYQIDLNTGNFTYIPSQDDGLNKEKRQEKMNKIRKEFSDEDVF